MLKRLRYRHVIRSVDQSVQHLAETIAHLDAIMPEVLTPAELQKRDVLRRTFVAARRELLELQEELQGVLADRALTRRQRFVRVMAIMDCCRSTMNYWTAVQRVEIDAQPALN